MENPPSRMEAYRYALAVEEGSLRMILTSLLILQSTDLSQFSVYFPKERE